MDKIVIRGAKEHNLKNIDLDVPKNKFVVVTGVSGSGKSSLAFDTIYAEGQRRYVESLSTYARQFLGLKSKPDVEYIEGLSPAIAIQQRVLSHNPRSIVGTITEIYDYMRVLFARAGVPFCPNDHIPITSHSIDEIVDEVLKLSENTKFAVLAPIVRGKKGTFRDVFPDIQKKGYVRVRVDGKIYSVSEAHSLKLSKNTKHRIDVVVDRLAIKKGIRTRLYDSMELASRESEGLIAIMLIDEKSPEKSEEMIYSQNFFCPECGWSLPELSPRIFSFNNPFGACASCSGLGFVYSVDPMLMIRDKKLSLQSGLLAYVGGFGSGSNYMSHIVNIASKQGFDLTKPFEKLNEGERNYLFWGKKGSFEGVANIVERRFNQTKSPHARNHYLNFFTKVPCRHCSGARLKDEVLSVQIKGKNIWDLTSSTVSELGVFFKELDLQGEKKKIVEPIVREITARLEFLNNVGLSYISLDRSIDTLSGGELERIKLATQLGTKLTGVIYILDEPTIGLHPKDTKRLLRSLTELRDLGNTVIAVEHDRETIEMADWVVDLGPGSGIHGGEVVFEGNYKSLLKSNNLTGKYLSHKKQCSLNQIKTRSSDHIKVYGAEEFNLKRINVKIPLNRFVCITGVSGAGKSTLLERILYQGILWETGVGRKRPGKYSMFKNLSKVNGVQFISQHPIGRSSKSNIATYTKILDIIRALFSKLPESKMRGYTSGRYSFNVKGGRCEACRGYGEKRIEMHFLPAIYVKCDVCKGKRFNSETLEIKYKGKSIADILDMTVEEANSFFSNIPALRRRLQLLVDVGLSYIKLGQPAPTLSGGEAQRIKLGRELSKKTNKGTIYFMDEPTTGLHFEDMNRLLKVIEQLRDKGNTVVVIEHNLDFVKNADWILDMGPGGGDDGGYIVAEGSPTEIMKIKASSTGRYLKKYPKEVKDHGNI